MRHPGVHNWVALSAHEQTTRWLSFVARDIRISADLCRRSGDAEQAQALDAQLQTIREARAIVEGRKP